VRAQDVGEVIEMAFAVFLIVLATVGIASSVVGWFARRRSRDAPGPGTPGPVDPWASLAAIFQADSHGDRAEAVLITWLLAGHLSAEEYREEMAVLAARDALRRPLVAPPHRDL
jgi:hypothetical protein